MSAIPNPYFRLAAFARQGKRSSAERLVDELRPQLKRLIRRAIRGQSTNARLRRLIQRETREMGANWFLLDSDDRDLIDKLALRVARSIVGRLQKSATSRAEVDTLCDRRTLESMRA